MDEAMRSYYEQRAPEYDDWWLGTGRFRARERPGWHDEVAELCATLGALPPARTLDVACGTGFLTVHLPGDVTGLDQSAGMLAIAARRRPDARFVQGDGLAPPFAPGAFERVHSAHFYGHLDPGQRRRFLDAAGALAGELVVVDSARRPDREDESWEERILDDGSRHSVYKRWFGPEELRTELGGGDVLLDGDWFVAVRRVKRGQTPIHG
jgi:demethylmenaquinone methyltransferase/2-methoxy-6-polyprenyl-1,4-benzoquinol methylase